MSKKSPAIAERLRAFAGGDLDPHYAGYFDCFNRQLFYEAHDVLEELWLQDRRGPAGDFYKGLIQFAGAFVHVQKGRPQPAVALLNLAAANLTKYGPEFERLNIGKTLELIGAWRARLQSAGDVDRLLTTPPQFAPESAPAGK